MAQLNEVFLMGNLSRDPRVNRMAGGSVVANLSLALNRSFKGNDDRQREEVCFVDVTVWGKQAEWCGEALKKGSRVHVRGHLKQEGWDDKKTGEKRSKIIVEAERIQFLDRKEKVHA